MLSWSPDGGLCPAACESQCVINVSFVSLCRLCSHETGSLLLIHGTQDHVKMHNMDNTPKASNPHHWESPWSSKSPSGVNLIKSVLTQTIVERLLVRMQVDNVRVLRHSAQTLDPARDDSSSGDFLCYRCTGCM